MNQQLFEDARSGNIEGIIPNLQYNSEMSEWTPLHLACLFGKVDFARKFLQENPGFLKLENPDGCTALHLASSNGHLQIVELLLEPDTYRPVHIRELCLKKDKSGMNPLHHAVIKNHFDVVKKLLEACPESALDLTTQKETVFHLAVKNIASPSDTVLQVLLDCPYAAHLLNLADKKGNTVLHLAIVRKQVEVIRQLLETASARERGLILEVNAVNSSGLTPCDVLVVDPMSQQDVEIEEMIIFAGGIRLNESYEQRENLKNITTGLFLMASIVAAASCQIAVYLHGAYWSGANVTSISNNSTTVLERPLNASPYKNDDNVMEKYHKYILWVFLDGMVLLLSFGTIVFLLFPVPAKQSLFKWVTLRFISYITLTVCISIFMLLACSRVLKWGFIEIIYAAILVFLLNTNIILMVIPSTRMTQIRRKGWDEFWRHIFS